MPSIDCVLDTTPIARSVDKVQVGIVETTVAVGVMQEAVILAEKEASDHICKNVDRGFFNLINSRNSIKRAENFTELQAKTGLLLEFSKSLSALHDRMEADCNRLKREYSKVFQGLDKSLENRIKELDRDAMTLGEVKISLFSQKTANVISKSVCTGNESMETAHMVITANLNAKTSKALDSLSNNDKESEQCKSQISSFIEDREIDKECEEYIPVVFSRAKAVMDGAGEIAGLYMPESVDEVSRQRISTSVNNCVDKMTGSLKSTEEKQAVSSAFWQMLNTSDLDDRHVDVMQELFRNGGC